ncbi:MAG TPA: hypothetical protein VD884_16260 [Ohtaekwangia sp.]|nr:hypothetical protein [Ohtaekwangia sp.]
MNLYKADAQYKSSISVLAKPKHDGLWLRWAPADPIFWKLGNKNGYTIERITLNTDGEMEPDSKIILTPSPVKPVTAAEFEMIGERSDEAATLGEILYGEDANQTLNGNDFEAILSNHNALENSYGIAMLMCDLSLDAANAGGLFYKDVTVKPGSRYVYRISIPETPASVNFQPGVIVVSVAEEKPLLKIENVEAEFGDLAVTLRWPTLLHKGEYSAYHIQRSEDGKRFQNITDFPYIHMSAEASREAAFYVDSLASNQKKYSYRIYGISPFAESGPFSNVVSGEGKDNLFGLLVIREAKPTEHKTVSVQWKFPVEMENQIEGFIVSKADNPDGPFKDVDSRKAISKEQREFTDKVTFNNTYYVLRAIDKNRKEVSRSFPYLVQVADDTPPATPLNITGRIDKNGVVNLNWQANSDSDLLGYRVFRSNGVLEEPVEVTKDILLKNFFMDTVNTQVLNKKVYYSLIAVDRNYNTSDYSKPFELSRPDIIAPAAVVIQKAEMAGDSLKLQWINSVSTDVERYELSRIEHDEKLNRVIKTWKPGVLSEAFTDTRLLPGKRYAYVITVFDSAGNKSETRSREVLFEPGFRVSVTGITSEVNRTDKKITLQWKNNEAATRCHIFRKLNDGYYILYQTLEGNAETFIDKNIHISNTYSYKIQPQYGKGVKAILSKEIKVLF